MDFLLDITFKTLESFLYLHLTKSDHDATVGIYWSYDFAEL